MAVIGGDGAIAPLLLTIFQKVTIGSLIHICKEVACTLYELPGKDPLKCVLWNQGFCKNYSSLVL